MNRRGASPMGKRLAWLPLAVLLLSCAHAGAPTVEAAMAPTPNTLPTVEQIVNAPACVRTVADARLANAKLTLARGQGHLPSLGHDWDDKAMRSDLSYTPYDLGRAWDAQVQISASFKKALDEADVSALEGVGVKTGSRSSRVLYGTVPLYELVCFANLPFVEEIEAPHNSLPSLRH